MVRRKERNMDGMKEKRSFFGAIKGMFVGIVRPSEYIENGKRSSTCAAIILALLVSLIIPLFTFYLPVNRIVGNGKLANMIENELPDFRIDADGFYCENRYVWTDENTTYIQIDTSDRLVDDEEVDALLNSAPYQSIVIVAKEEVFMYSDGTSQTMAWADFYSYLIDTNRNGKTTFDKQSIFDLVDKYDTPVIVTIYIVMVIAAFLGFLICCALWALIGLLTASVNHADISYGELLKAAIYIRIIWYIIKKVLKTYVFMGSSTLLWTIVFVVILVYLILAVCQYAKKNSNNYPMNSGMSNNMYYGGGQMMGDTTGQYQQPGTYPSNIPPVNMNGQNGNNFENTNPYSNNNNNNNY